jgi:hypothetical protein
MMKTKTKMKESMIRIIENADLVALNNGVTPNKVTQAYESLVELLPPKLQGEAKEVDFILEDSSYDLNLFVERRLTIRALNASQELQKAIHKIFPKVLLVSVYKQ